MNAEITDKVANELLKWVQSTGEFVSEQAPDVANQIVAYGLWSNGIGAALGLIPLVIGLLLFVGAYYLSKADETEAVWGFGIFGTLFSFVGLIYSFSKVYGLIMVNVAPKLYIIEYISNLVK